MDAQKTSDRQGISSSCQYRTENFQSCESGVWTKYALPQSRSFPWRRLVIFLEAPSTNVIHPASSSCLFKSYMDAKKSCLRCCFVAPQTPEVSVTSPNQVLVRRTCRPPGCNNNQKAILANSRGTGTGICNLRARPASCNKTPFLSPQAADGV